MMVVIGVVVRAHSILNPRTKLSPCYQEHCINHYYNYYISCMLSCCSVILLSYTSLFIKAVSSFTPAHPVNTAVQIVTAVAFVTYEYRNRGDDEKFAHDGRLSVMYS